MTSKKCNGCKNVKSISEFGNHKRMPDGLRSSCKQCESELKKAYKKTKKGFICTVYDNQKSHSLKRGHIVPEYTKEELYLWAIKQPIFHELFEAWIASGYEKMLTPSFDRTNDYQGYCLDRLQIITWEENASKGNADRVNGINNKMNKTVNQLSLEGELINKHHSVNHAGRITNISFSNIAACCRGERDTAGGFKWKYA